MSLKYPILPQALDSESKEEITRPTISLAHNSQAITKNNPITQVDSSQEASKRLVSASKLLGPIEQLDRELAMIEYRASTHKRRRFRRAG